MQDEIVKQIEDSINVKNKIITNKELLTIIEKSAKEIINCYKIGGKLLLCGNGGSAGDAQHIAGEMIARFRLERKALSAIAFNTNSSVVTAIGNDYEYNYIFER